MDRNEKPPAATGGEAGGLEYTAHNISTADVVLGLWNRKLRPVPCRGKKPYHNGWTTKVFDIRDFDRFDNVGVVLGDAVAVDIDISDPDNAEKIEMLAVEALGRSSCRVGRWPRRALLYRSTEAMNKTVTRKTTAGMVEVLATGQQVVVHGTHPDTGQPYRWRGVPPWAAGFELVTVTPEQVEAFMADAEALLGLDPVEVVSGTTATATTPMPAPSIDTDAMPRAEDLAKALAKPWWDSDWEPDWHEAAFCLKKHPQGRAIWMHWSATSPKHTDAEATSKWSSVKADCDPVAGARAIMKRVPTTELQAWWRAHRIAELANDPAVAHGGEVADAIMPSRRAAPEATDDVEHDEQHDDDEGAPEPPQGHREAVPEHLLSVPGVLGFAVDYYNATARHAQPAFAVAAALAFGAVVMGRRWCSSNRNFASHYHLLVVATGAGKEHAKTALEKMLDHSALGHLLGPADYTSASGVHHCLLRRPAHVSVMDEMGRKMAAARRASNQHKSDALTAVMEVFGRQDGTYSPVGYAGAGLASRQHDDLERVVRRPSLTLVGMSTPSSLELALDSDDVASGLLNRFIVVRGDDTLRKARRLDRLPEVPPPLIDWARETAGAHGAAGNLTGVDAPDMPPEPVVMAFDDGAAAVFDAFEHDLIGWRQHQPARDLLGRSLEISMRLALIVARSIGADTITAEAARWAVHYTRHHHQSFLADVGALTAGSDFERLVRRVVETVRKAGARGCTARDLAKAVRGWGAVKPHEREAVLKVAVADHGLRLGQRQPKAGPKTPCWFIR